MEGVIRSFIAWVLSGSLLIAQSISIYTEISPPDQFLGPDGQPTGFAVELVQELQRRTRSTEPIKIVPWVRGYKEALSRPNVILFTMARTAERNTQFSWIGPINEDVYSFYTRSDSRILLKNLEEAKRIGLIGVYKEDVRDQYLTNAGFTNLDRSVDEVVMFKKLMAGRIDAITCLVDGFAQIAKLAGYKPEDVREALPFLKVQAYIAISKGTPETVVKSWSAALESLKKDGSFEQLFRKYYPGKPIPGPAIQPAQ